jgi:hypothetical protein
VALEKDIEARVRKYAIANGCLCMKFVSPGTAGMPDRMIVSQFGSVMFLELKAPGKKATPLQLATHQMMRAHGLRVHVVDSVEQGKAIIDGHCLD